MHLTWIMKILFISFVSILMTIKSAETCTCQPFHPQTQFCKADFVILARIKRETILNKDSKTYKIHIRKEYKMSGKTKVALKSGRLLTANNEAICGSAPLQLNKMYILSGRVRNLRARITLCDLAIPWLHATPYQRKGFRALYNHGCSCNVIKRSKRWIKHFTPNTCNSLSRCHVSNGICLRQKNNKCRWLRNKLMVNCMKEEHKNTTLSASHLTISR